MYDYFGRRLSAVVRQRSCVARCLAVALLIFSSASPVRAGAPISLDIRDLDIYDAVRLLSTQAAVNLVVDASVPHHNITLRLANVTFDEALQTLAQSNDLESLRVGKVIYLGTSEALNRRYPTSAAAPSRTTAFPLHNAASEDVATSLVRALPPGTTVVADPRTASVIVTGSANTLALARRTIDALDRHVSLANVAIPMRYVKASEALKALTGSLAISPPQSAFAVDLQNQILLTGSDDFIAQSSALIARIDRPGQQVRYDVRVTDIVHNDSSQIGFLYGGGVTTPNGTYTSAFLRNSLQINASLDALVSSGQGRILARPTISTLNNTPASLLVGQQYPIVYFDARTGTQQVQFVNIGVNLNVTPTIGADGTIVTDLETDYSSPQPGPQGFPIISTRKAQSTLRVRDGETIVIAGLFQDIDSKTLTKVPFLGDLPFIGEIFRQRVNRHDRDEVIFLLTPHLIADDDPKKDTPPVGIMSN